MELAIIVTVVVVALVFDYTNGFHDASNAIATSISTHALTPRVALGMAAAMNFVGAFLGQQVARTVSETITPPSGQVGLIVVLAGLLGAISWNLITWYFGLPASSSHALIGGLIGAALVASAAVNWSTVISKVLVPLVLTPVLAFALGFLMMLGIMWGFRDAHPTRANSGFRMAQTVSAAAMALGHGLQDAQKTMGVIFLALATGGYVGVEDDLPLWVVVVAATAISLGTWAGGWRIMRTLGRRIIALDPPRGFAAESVAATVLYGAAILQAPISSTHTITTAVMGVGATKRLSAVRWGVAGSIITAWALTLPMAALVAALVYWPLHLLIN
ncbi:MAG: inorganic phosphate transporter [Nocardioides sp.]